MDEMDKFIYFYPSIQEISLNAMRLQRQTLQILYSPEKRFVSYPLYPYFIPPWGSFTTLSSIYFFRILICLQFYLPWNFSGSGLFYNQKILLNKRIYSKKKIVRFLIIIIVFCCSSFIPSHKTLTFTHTDCSGVAFTLSHGVYLLHDYTNQYIPINVA